MKLQRRGLSIFLCNGQVECLWGDERRQHVTKCPRWSTKKNRLLFDLFQQELHLGDGIEPVFTVVWREPAWLCHFWAFLPRRSRLEVRMIHTHKKNCHGVQSSSPPVPAALTSGLRTGTTSQQTIYLSASHHTPFLLCRNCSFVKEMAHKTLHANLLGLLPANYLNHSLGQPAGSLLVQEVSGQRVPNTSEGRSPLLPDRIMGIMGVLALSWPNPQRNATLWLCNIATKHCPFIDDKHLINMMIYRIYLWKRVIFIYFAVRYVEQQVYHAAQTRQVCQRCFRSCHQLCWQVARASSLAAAQTSFLAMAAMGRSSRV